MATKLVFDSIENDDATTSVAPKPRAVETSPELPEPERRPYPGYVRVGILLGGAVACWAAIAGVISAL